MKKGRVEQGGAWALVTGAGSGIGYCYARQLAALGYNLVIVGSNAARLEAAAEKIREEAGGRTGAAGVLSAAGTGTGRTSAVAGETLTATDKTSAVAGETPTTTGKTHAAGIEVVVIPMDLARIEAAQELYDRTVAAGIGIDVLVNNAGIFSFSDILTTPAGRIERIILLHDLTLTQLCRLYAADMVRRGGEGTRSGNEAGGGKGEGACRRGEDGLHRGRDSKSDWRGYILNMSSYSLWMPFPGLSLYSASKAYVRSFSVSFAKEVHAQGIRVTAVCPAGVATDLFGLSPRWQRIGKRFGALITPETCARRGLRALWRGRRCIVPDWWNRLWIPLCKALPMWVLRPIRDFTMKFQK